MNEIETIDTTSPLYEIQLTHDECETFSEYLPDGFTLVEVAQTPAKSLSRSTRKSFHSDIHNSHTKTDHEPGTTPKASPEGRVLRDHSKAKVRDQLGRRYSDYGSMPMTSSRPFKTTNEGMKKCYNLLQKVKKNKNSEPFRSRADGDEYGLADYYAMLPEPIDLSIVEERLRAEEYKSVNHFAADIRKIWNNSFRYMPKGSDAHLMTIEISSYFEELFKDIEDVTFSDTVKDLEKKVELLSQKITEMNTSGTKSNGSGGNGSMSASKSSSGRGRSMSLEDKKLLCRNIKKLPPEHLKGVWDIVGQGLKYTMDNREILEFDVHSLPMKVTRQLEKYVKQKMVEISKPANANGKGKGKGKGSNQKQEKQQKQKQQQPQTKNGKPAVFTQNINVMPVKLAKPDLNYHGLYDDVPLEQTIHEMEDYFAESSRGVIRREGETESKSGDSSFISDSDSESELGNKHKKRLVETFARTSQELLSYTPGDLNLYPF